MARGDFLKRAPFDLDAKAVAWVQETLDSLTPDERVGQLFNFLLMGDDRAWFDRIMALKPGGITRHVGRDGAAEVGLMQHLFAQATVPLLVSADLEGSRMSLPIGTEVPNPLALAAVGDLAASRDISALMADEARAIGINWSFTPVLDINAAWRSAIVATRGFGQDLIVSATRPWRRSPNSRPAALPPRPSTGRAKAMTTATSIC